MEGKPRKPRGRAPEAEGKGGSRATADDITVLVVDDHDMVRKGLRHYLEAQTDIRIVGEAPDVSSAVSSAAELVPDVVLMDLALPERAGEVPDEQGGVRATRQIREVSPSTRVVVLTSFAQDELVLSAMKAGALSYLLKDADAETVLRTIRAARRGEAVLHARVAGRLMAELRAPSLSTEWAPNLTERELEVLRLVAQGLCNGEIASRLQVTERTVKAHVSNLLAKLEVTDRTQAAVFAWRRGLVRE